ncbi:extracellular solute-binding protein [Spirochaeta cellobiosiphila]|uniref:extracellular solute-binding protein n=1 Tax=Spirochaeta cellobiosiphila TaxID=504483 RepID=UPI000403DAD3|nr:extracellular solute-binding protein [Spirochaeta cellobiosiphila]
MYRMSIILLILICTGCNGKLEETKELPSELDLVNLTIQMVGDPPLDLPIIESTLNEMAQQKLNCTVHFQYTTWSDYMQRYQLLLSSGEPIDLIFTSDWLYFSQFAMNGAFLELDNLLPMYASDLLEYIPSHYWKTVAINNKIYTIPSIWEEYVNEGFLFREDLRSKYNLPIPEDFKTIEQYLDTIHQKLPEQPITAAMVIDSGYGPFFSAMSVLEMKYSWVDKNMPYGLVADYANPDELYCYWETSEFREDMKMFKRWADKGFWTKSSLSNKNPLQEAFLNQHSVAILYGQNPMKFSNISTLFKREDSSIKVGYHPYSQNNKLVKPVSPIHNGMAIPQSSKHPDRALMFYQELLLNSSWNRLTQYGIQDQHYTIDKEGYYVMLGNKDTNGFTRESMNSWAWRNPQSMLFDRSYNTVLKLFKEFDTYAQPDIFSGFVEDYSPYEAERSALYQIVSQYLVPIEAGFVEDVDQSVSDFLKRAKEAGLDKIHEDYKKQWINYCKNKGYQ